MTISLEEFQRLLAEASTGGALRRLVRSTLKDAAFGAERAAKLRVTGGNPLNSRSGRLRASIRSGARSGSRSTQAGTIEGFLRAGGPSRRGVVRYARLQEFGSKGPITPKKGKWLAIPTKAQKTAAGVSRGGPRTVQGLWFHQTHPDKAYLLKRIGRADRRHRARRGKNIALFLLLKSVVVPARPFLRPSIDEAAAKLPAALAPLLARSMKADL